MSFSQEVKHEIKDRLSKKNTGFTIPQNTNNIYQAFGSATALACAFLRSGTVSDPGRSYHLEIACDDEEEASLVSALMSEQGFKVRSALRKEKNTVYLKDRESIADFLGFIGAVKAMMKMENSLILKDMRNSVNRKVNFETANIERTVGAALKDIEDIRYIEAHGGLKQLPSGLREMAEIRVENPDAPLKSLGDAMEPPLGKSGVNHRLRKIREFADRLRERKE